MIEDKMKMVEATRDSRLRIQYLNEIEWMSKYLPEEEDQDTYTHLGETYEA